MSYNKSSSSNSTAATEYPPERLTVVEDLRFLDGELQALYATTHFVEGSVTVMKEWKPINRYFTDAKGSIKIFMPAAR